MIDTWILSICRCGHREACIIQVTVDVMDGLLVCIIHDVEDNHLQGISEEIESLYS
jgi:pyruvate/2-oxoglutarate dehydrogenase complex dihydrolipoamide acyltransferase (E2) component